MSSPSRPESVAQMMERISRLFMSFLTTENCVRVLGSTLSCMRSGKMGRSSARQRL